jgi:CheY-like chemotaxis protein
MNISAPDILLVEDSPSDVDLFMLAHQMNKSAATISVARDGQEAVDVLLGGESRSGGAQNSLPRLVLLDLNMPRLNGFEVLERLRADERTRLLPVVIFSASDQRSDELEAQRLGANGYVRKPARFENLRAALAQFERDWLKTIAA